ncbi:ABC transporter permease [Paraliomyxa miuraensis]|uniref:ABC transporter permease n=1 Tax=Paraliomyxa miuraensis TaxID=376150 RepID=UPI002258135F|nr:ABC transporter permease [Paraliomyxa miuraensis]MCX4243611.1 ABC transporter permease [Paraliomyxa miuraensis]
MIPIRYNLRNLAVRRATTLATALGVGLVVFVLAAALMLTEGLRRTLSRSGQPDNAVVMRKGSDNELSSSIANTQVGQIASAPGVKKDADGRPLAVGDVVAVIFADLANGKGKSNIVIRGVTPEGIAFRPEVKVVEGTLPRPGTEEVMVGRKIARRFEGLDLGGELELRKNRSAKVVGVFEAGGSSYESEVWGDLDYVAGAFGREGMVSMVRVRLESPALFDGFAAAVEQDKRLGFDAMPELEFYEKASEQTAVFITAMGVIIAVFFSIGAMIGAMITMYGAVANRRSEIGVLRALGFSRTTILVSFLFESVLLSLLGGLLGIAAASTLGMVKFSMMNFQTFSEIVFAFEPTSEILISALVFGGVMGVIGGFLPAIRAARTAPIEAMRG